MSYQIIHILPGKANPNTQNGVNIVVDALANEQQKMGLSVCVMGVASNTVKRHNPTYHYKLFERSWNRLHCKKEWTDFLLGASDERTVFHFHSVFMPWYLSLIRLLKRNGRNHIVLTPHGQYVDAAMRPLRKRLCFYFFDRHILREVERVHLLAELTEKNAFIENNAHQVEVIPNGIYCEDTDEQRLPSKLKIGFLGRLECRQKGLDVLIQAFSQYKKEGGNATLALAGSGPDEHKLKEMALTLNISDSVVFVGKVLAGAKQQFIRSCAAFISPSRWEGIPLSCLEVASEGCPLLITRQTNLEPYVVRHHAGIVIPECEKNYVLKLLHDFEKAYTNKNKYRTICRGAREMIVKELNWPTITRKMVETLYGIKI